MSYKVFIAYSGNARVLGDTVALQLANNNLDIDPWVHAFPLGKGIFDGVLDKARHDDFGVFAFASDDFQKVAGNRDFLAPNVVFELGVFAGAKGKERAFLLLPKGHEDDLPADLRGIRHATYDPQNIDGSVVPACLEIRNQIQKLAGTDCHLLLNKKSGHSLDVLDFSMEDGASIIQWPCHGGPNQLWSLEKVQEGTFKITSQNSGKCLEVKDGSLEEDAPVVQGTYTGAAHQRWLVIELHNGTYQIQSRHSGKCLAVRNRSTTRKALIVQRTWSDDASGMWLLADSASIH